MVEIQVPSEYVELCEHWHSGQSDLLYAVSSTGNLTIGNRRPLGCETDEQWHLQLYRELESDASYAERMANKSKHADYQSLRDFTDWVRNRIIYLESEYGLQDWENVA